MFRQSLLPRACLTLALWSGAVLRDSLVLCGASPASAQDRSTYERLDRLERDLNMLQRQVYRGAPAPMYAPMAPRRSMPSSAWIASKPRCAS